jgi:hypothetical protein
MPYSAPTGWLETIRTASQFRSFQLVFHRLAECDAIKNSATLTATARPYSAKRCRACAAR